ncbi:CNT family concentrative nucleoside transporter [Luteimonas cucumeris]|uniref:CNT family concentrative nucleoside transporter n=1 Tax=Luteimonas cucumeris TaxID=985012 RepID=A0A562LFA8_9GAMM|nr:nucleoside transporter C-terminal domain-containing protein [Luteimonas cucumeris]TWI06294.1 CNT family concentrative nucleoside transporter [Luteimonas cucumeris]
MEGLARVGFGLFGLAVLVGIAWLFSSHRKQVDWRLVLTGVALQIVFAAFVLLTSWGERIFDGLSKGFVAILGFTNVGSSLIFGGLADPSQFGFVFAFQVLPTIIFFASLMGVLYHLGVMQWIVRGMAWAITKVMRVSGAETTSVCASIFIGQTEAPLTIRPYISRMTQSELLTIMIGGMAHIAGGVLAAYVQMLGGGDPAQQAFYAKHLLTASIMAAPATLVIAKVLVPETQEPLTRGTVKMEVERTTANVIDGAAAGAADGLKLALNVGAMLLAFTALIALLNWPLEAFGQWTGLTDRIGQPFNLSLLLGYAMAPIAWVIGTPLEDAVTVGGLIGQKIVLNEFIAYQQLSQIIQGNVDGVVLTEQGKLIATYALCGFANFSSIAIQIGGIGGLAPERRHDLAKFGLRAVLGGSIATFMTATIAGVLTWIGS